MILSSRPDVPMSIADFISKANNEVLTLAWDEAIAASKKFQSFVDALDPAHQRALEMSLRMGAPVGPCTAHEVEHAVRLVKARTLMWTEFSVILTHLLFPNLELEIDAQVRTP